jgi:hypothetical protein
VPATRREVFERVKHLKTTKCPFANLPELTAGRWGEGLTSGRIVRLMVLRKACNLCGFNYGDRCLWMKPGAGIGIMSRYLPSLFSGP